MKTSFREIELIDKLWELPDISSLDVEKLSVDHATDLFICALGFEDRCLAIPKMLASIDDFSSVASVCFTYSTNTEDNDINQPQLLHFLSEFSKDITQLEVDEELFATNFKKVLERTTSNDRAPRVLFDISSCSSSVIIPIFRILLQHDIELKILYSESEVYHPTIEEFDKSPKYWTTEEGFGHSRGIGSVHTNPECAGSSSENPELIISFPTFKPERTNAIIAYIDETLLVRPGDRIIWIIGDPHMKEQLSKRRKNIIREINSISSDKLSYEVSTLDYKETLKILEQIYQARNLDFHINISALGSKMQSIGTSIFSSLRTDVSVYFASPTEYNPKQSSEGCKDKWIIDFGDACQIRKILDSVDHFETKGTESADIKTV